MDPMELWSGKTLVETEVRGDSDDDLGEEAPTSLDGYATGGVEEERRRSPVRQEVLEPAPLQPLTNPTMHGHPQCPLSACVGDDVGLFDICPRPHSA